MSMAKVAIDMALPFWHTTSQWLAGMRFPRMIPFASPTPMATV